MWLHLNTGTPSHADCASEWFLGLWFLIVQNWSARWWLWRFARIWTGEAMCLIVLMAQAFGYIYLVLELPYILRGPMAGLAWVNWRRVHLLCPCWPAAGSPNHYPAAASFRSPISCLFTGTKFCLVFYGVKWLGKNLVPVNFVPRNLQVQNFAYFSVYFTRQHVVPVNDLFNLFNIYRYKILPPFGCVLRGKILYL